LLSHLALVYGSKAKVFSDRGWLVVGARTKSAKGGGTLSLFNQRFLLPIFRYICSAVVTLLSDSADGQRFSTRWTSVSLFAFTQPFSYFAFLDSFKVRSKVDSVFRVALCRFFTFVA
jgi:hypothetical protein